MAAKSATVLENHIKLFVEAKIGERIAVEFSTGCVYVRSVQKQGSTTLGAFWIRVLQNYFPRGLFTYEKNYSATLASEAITVHVEDIVLTVYLRTGLLTVEGDLVHEWFKVVFCKIMEQYDCITFARSTEYFKDQVILDMRKKLQQQQKISHQASADPEIIDSNLALVSSDVHLPEEKVKHLNERQLRFDENESHREITTSTHDAPTSGLGVVALKDGERYIYPLWKQLLNKWLSREQCLVYICSKHIDVDRLKDIIAIAYKNRLVMKLEAIFTEPASRHGKTMTQTKQAVLSGHTADEQLFIEYKVFNKICLPSTKSLSCNFIAAACNGVVELMLTSATFDYDGMVKSNSLSSVTLTKILEEDFQSNFLDSLSRL